MSNTTDPTFLTIAFSFLEDIAWLASYLGLLLTCYAAWSARDAKLAATEAKNKIFKLDAASMLSKTITMLDEIQSHHRNKHNAILPDRYSTVINQLQSVKATCEHKEDQDTIAEVCVQMKTAKHETEKCLEKDMVLNVTRQNKLLTDQSTTLQSVLSRLKKDS